MPTFIRGKNPKPKDHAESLCGKCDTALSRKDVKDNFKTTCTVCHKKCFLHSKCALKVLKSHNIKLNHQAFKKNAQVFRQSKIDLWCIHCEDDCFWCKVQHTSKYNCIEMNM